MIGAQFAGASIRTLTPFVGAANAQWIVARAYAIAYLVYFQLSIQYAKAALGLLWVIATPALFLAVYLPVNTAILHARLSEGGGVLQDGFMVVAGFLVWVAFQEGFFQGAASIAHNPAVVQNTPTPPALLPFVKVTTAFVGLAITVVLFLAVVVLTGNSPGHRLLMLPAAFAVFYVFTLGGALFFAAIAVYVRDVLQLIPTLLTIEFFACPIVYSPSQASGKLAIALQLNPMTPFLALFRASLIANAPFAWQDFAFAAAWASLAFLTGAVLFRRLEDGFADAF
jgi:ABC-type polysaccharide/polyol phosphate export permease